MYSIDFENLSEKIKNFLYSYVKIESFTDSFNEKSVEKFFLDYFSNITYFQNNSEYYGLYKIEKDTYNRNVCWAMVKGSGSDTVVLIHHYDIVGIEDFKQFKDLAFSPEELRTSLIQYKDMFSEEVQKDLIENKFIFGRGCADMKGGGSIQYILLEEYSKINNFKGNVIVIGVPDEENLSAGMRSAVKLLSELKNKYNLNYKFMINSEPHQRKHENVGMFSEGSIGKLMPFIYVRGFLAHAGKVFEGLNPANIMSEIVRRTELNMDFADHIYPENAPAPTWLYLRDSKESYDVSMPLNMYGCLSVLTFTQTPEQLMEKVKKICEVSFDRVIKDMNDSYKVYLKNTGQEERKLPWEVSVMSFKQLYDQAEHDSGTLFVEQYKEKLELLTSEIKEKRITFIECNFRLIDFIFDYTKDISPKVIYGLIPPYYPSVANINFKDLSHNLTNISKILSEYSNEKFNIPYDKEYYYTGISDLSYSYVKDVLSVEESMEEYMPLFGNVYTVPIKEIGDISMPCINIGPWGKDFHKITERVNKNDLLIYTPQILNHAIHMILNE